MFPAVPHLGVGLSSIRSCLPRLVQADLPGGGSYSCRWNTAGGKGSSGVKERRCSCRFSFLLEVFLEKLSLALGRCRRSFFVVPIRSGSSTFRFQRTGRSGDSRSADDHLRHRPPHPQRRTSSDCGVDHRPRAGREHLRTGYRSSRLQDWRTRVSRSHYALRSMQLLPEWRLLAMWGVIKVAIKS